MRAQHGTKRSLIISLLKAYPDSSFAFGRKATANALAMLLADCSTWAIGNAVDAFLEGRNNGKADPAWWPSAPVLLRLIERLEEARNALEGSRLEHTVARLKLRAIESMPSPEDVRRNTGEWRAANQGSQQ